MRLKNEKNPDLRGVVVAEVAVEVATDPSADSDFFSGLRNINKSIPTASTEKIIANMKVFFVCWSIPPDCGTSSVGPRGFWGSNGENGDGGLENGGIVFLYHTADC